MQKKKIILICIIAVILIASVGAYLLINYKNSADVVDAKPADGENLTTLRPEMWPKNRVGFINYDDSIQRCLAVQTQLEKSCTENGLTLTILNCGGDRSIAVAQAEQLLSQKVDMLVVYGWDESTLRLTAEKAVDKNVPVLSLDYYYEGIYNYGVDEQKAGELAGNALSEHANEQGGVDLVIKVISSEMTRNEKQRVDAALKTLCDKNDIPDDIIIEVDGQGNHKNAYDRVLQRLKDTPQRKRVMIICLNDEYAVGALAAVDEMGLGDTAGIVSFGASSDAIANMKLNANAWLGSVTYPDEGYGEAIVKQILDTFGGKADVSSDVRIDHVLMSHNNAV